MAVRNVARIVRSDVKSLFANVMSIIIAVGLVVMPSDRKSTRLNSSHYQQSRMPSSA